MKILHQLRTGVTLYRIIKKFILTVLQSSTKISLNLAVLAGDLLFNSNSTESFNIIKNRVDKTNFLTWAGLHHAVPHEFKTNMMSPIIKTLLFIVKNRQSMTACGYCCCFSEHCSETNHIAIKGIIKQAKYKNVFGLVAY